jgi:hypothetical protein
MEKHMIPFAPTQEGDKELIELAFSKKKADERKEWLRQFKVSAIHLTAKICQLIQGCSHFQARNFLGSSLRGDSVLGIHQQGADSVLNGG